MHGTSGRTSYTIKEKKTILPYFLYKLLSNMKIKLPVKKTWEYVTGTRRTVLKNYEGGFYGSNAFRQQYHDFFKNKLHKGETIYYEIVGYVNKKSNNNARV